MNSQYSQHMHAKRAPVPVVEPVACRDSFHDSFGPFRTRRLWLYKAVLRRLWWSRRLVGGRLGGPVSASLGVHAQLVYERPAAEQR
jgi:hypothetical protein